MSKIKSLLFLGGSSEGSGVAIAAATELTNTALVHPWWSSGVFRPLVNTLDGLMQATKKYDFAVFLLTPDDFIKSRKLAAYTARDNVLFEFGLFLGALGPRRVAAFVQDSTDRKLKIPSDFHGVTLPRFSAANDDEIRSSMVLLRRHVDEMIKAEGPRQFELVIGWDIDKEEKCFVVELGPNKMRTYSDKIVNRKLVLICRKRDPLISKLDDTRILKSEPRLIRPGEEDVRLSVDLTTIFESLKPRDIIDAYLVLIPDNYDPRPARTMQHMIEAGCLVLDRDFGRPFE